MKQHHVTFKARRNHGLPLSPVTVTVSVRGKPTPEQVHDKAMRELLKQFPGTCGSQWYTRELLVEEIRAHGYAVEFRSFCEDGETPGILGQFAGLTIHNRKAVKIATTGRSDAMILAILAHELEHVEGAEVGTDYPELGLRCGGTISKGVSAMNYNLTKPCDECPFLLGSGFTFQSLTEHAAGEFACHKACVLDEETSTYEPRGEKTPHCAGALIFLEKQGKPHQMMRICERLNFYDPSKLDMNAPVGSKRSDYRLPTASERRRGKL